MVFPYLLARTRDFEAVVRHPEGSIQMQMSSRLPWEGGGVAKRPGRREPRGRAGSRVSATRYASAECGGGGDIDARRT